MDRFAVCFEDLDDPRHGNAALHDFLTLLIIALCAVLCGGQGAVDMALFARAKEPFLREFLDLKNGPPSHDTFSRMFRRLDPDQFRASFQRFMAEFSKLCQGVVAIDGKVLRRSYDTASSKSALHMVSAWGCEQRMVLGQIATDAQSNEITAVPKLLRMLSLKDTIVTSAFRSRHVNVPKCVTVDALNCQRAIASQIIEQGGDYALALKGNQPTLHADVTLFLDDPARAAGDAHTTVDNDNGRIETRTATVTSEIAWLQHSHKLARAGQHRQGHPHAGDTQGNDRRDGVLSAQHEAVRRALQRGGSFPLGGREPPPLAPGCHHERRSRSKQNGQQSLQSRDITSHGVERHSEGGIEGVAARQVQTGGLGQRLSPPTTGRFLKCDYPGFAGYLAPGGTVLEPRDGEA